MVRQERSGWRHRLRRVARAMVVAQALVIAGGVSLPALGRAPQPGREDKRTPRFERRPVIEPRGERGYVRRRDNVVDRKTHVEKRPSWRRPE